MKNEKFRNKSFYGSICCALNGLTAAFKEERNFKIYAAIAAVFLGLNVLTGSGKYDYAVFILSAAAVFGAELLNTATERVCDSLTQEENSDIHFIKDVSAGAVLMFGIGFFICQGITLISNLLD
ncbi:MAG: diacylglycerol kinase [Ruminococcus sp.]|nr:diacylglycerol kinase [Ruminococcus sp.]